MKLNRHRQSQKWLSLQKFCEYLTQKCNEQEHTQLLLNPLQKVITTCHINIIRL